jgi:hypothetical protein
MAYKRDNRRQSKCETLRRKQVRAIKYASFPSVLIPGEG